MAFDYRDNSAQVLKRIEAEYSKRRIPAACIVVANHAKELLSVEGTAKGAPGRNSKGQYTKGRLIYGATRSKPGEPPRLQTGHLRRSVAWEAEGLVGRVGTGVDYGRILQLLRNRPWLDRALREKQAEVNAILSRPMDF